ncbi:MAG TPA: ribbon-helix-helix domain-containing protein [Spirochaetia bacterium]|mgnify:FL=1|nr:ribbon-helix-helix domain-containing protein [Spirochaetales bacterium]HRY79802.1 ribbon-helix-helix domain-containing protein [Spirochaetia bacterium]HRZ89174.1 ribbon-helix-helix domain-containing protein [Spirochaetia bacterium]
MARKESTVTFKADEELLGALEGVPNRSEFIRHAVLAALDNRCPLCRGTGILTPEQKVHWETFSRRHRIEECVDCHAWHLVCEADPAAPAGP